MIAIAAKLPDSYQNLIKNLAIGNQKIDNQKIKTAMPIVKPRDHQMPIFGEWSRKKSLKWLYFLHFELNLINTYTTIFVSTIIFI